LYSENFIYRDIKEKVIGKTCNYYPEIGELLVELISGNDKHEGYISEGDYNYLNLTSEYLFYETFDQSRLFTYNLTTGQTQQHTIEKAK